MSPQLAALATDTADRDAVSSRRWAKTNAELQDGELGDLRFRRLLSEDDWKKLPVAVRHRFSKRLEDGRSVVYVGRIAHVEFTRLGYVLAQLARLIGGPLPLTRDIDVPSVVTVTEDMKSGGQVWTRLYTHRQGFPQVIHSSKRFAGPTGLEEHVGSGVGMTLNVSATKRALYFKSDRYFIQLARFRIYLPHWLTPGQLTVGHTEIDPGSFAFTLKVEHPLLGQLMFQRAVFEESKP